MLSLIVTSSTLSDRFARNSRWRNVTHSEAVSVLRRDMDTKRILEERLREAVCVGDTDAVQDLVNLGVDVNARQPVSGW